MPECGLELFDPSLEGVDSLTADKGENRDYDRAEQYRENEKRCHHSDLVASSPPRRDELRLARQIQYQSISPEGIPLIPVRIRFALEFVANTSGQSTDRVRVPRQLHGSTPIRWQHADTLRVSTADSEVLGGAIQGNP